MAIRKKIAILAGSPECNARNQYICSLIKQAFSDNYDVCVFAMYEESQNTKVREQAESNIFTLVEYDIFEKIVVISDSIKTPGVLDNIKKALAERFKKEVVFTDPASFDENKEGLNKNPENDISVQSDDRVSGDIFDFNISTMEDEMLMQTEIKGLINVISSYVYKIRPFDSFNLCLNIGWSNESFLEDVGNYSFYSDNMIHAIECGAGSDDIRADLSVEFSRKLLIPKLSFGDKPKAYFFTPLFFGEHCFGYAAVNYGENIKCYNAAYKRWLSTVMHGLECFMRFNMKVVRQKQDEYRKLDIVSDILDNNRLIYYFQPIVAAGTGEIVAYEALMRTDTEEPVSPLDVLKYAEHLGRLCDVEKATFSNVLTFIEEHEDLFENKRVFINSIPGIHIPDDEADSIGERIRKLSRKIVVELTEQAEVDDKELAAMKKKFEKMGVDIAVDDYGTGYSNIYNLLRYMPNVVKIDRMLLSGIQLSAQKQHFVKEIIEFSHNNDITVLAEGVETPEELKMVTSLGIDLIQGYYTARPKAEVVSKIDNKIQNEIVQYGQFVIENKRRRTYEAGDESAVYLVKLVSEQYTKIHFSNDKDKCRDVQITGLPGFLANIEIDFDESYSGKITIKDVDLSVRNERPAIRLSKGCDVTISLEGDNFIEQGGILVPEGARLTMDGNGNLTIKQIAINGYGIGNDKDSKCGDLFFEHDGLITIHGNTMHAVGIGAGYGGNIHIDKGMYSFQLAGEESVGIGSLYSDIEMNVGFCALDFSIRSSVHVGVGSLKGNVKLNITRVGITGFFSSSRCVCIGTIDGKSAVIGLDNSTGEITAHSKCICVIGSHSADTDISLNSFSFTMTVDGDSAIALGNLDKTAAVDINTGDMIFDVTNNLDFDIGAETLNITGGYSEFKHNGEVIQR